eukprot:m.14058 g.14058  ORF g.14058 m.14058 type:complete len:471 (+) comp4976_c0_seq1:1539-2951(+)
MDTKKHCTVCMTSGNSSENQLLQCAGPCSMMVHQACYGVMEPPAHKWYCQRCCPYNLVRASKIKCHFCPIKEGALKKASDESSGLWSHVICALWHPMLHFDHKTQKNSVNVSSTALSQMGNAGCYICLEQRRSRQESDLGLSLECASEECKRKFHATCALKSGLLCADGGDEFVAFCSTCAKSKPVKAPLKTLPKTQTTPATHSTPEEPQEEPPDTSETADGRPTFYCPIDNCNRLFVSKGGFKYHVEQAHKKSFKGYQHIEGVASSGAPRRPSKDENERPAKRVRTIGTLQVAGKEQQLEMAKSEDNPETQFPNLLHNEQELENRKSLAAVACKGMCSKFTGELTYDVINFLQRMEHVQGDTSKLVTEVQQLQKDISAQETSLRDMEPLSVSTILNDTQEVRASDIETKMKDYILLVLNMVGSQTGCTLHSSEVTEAMQSVCEAIDKSQAGDSPTEVVSKALQAFLGAS